MNFDPKSIIDLNQFEGTISAKYNTMEQTCQNDDFGLRDDRSEKQRAEWKNYAKGLSEIYVSKGQVKSCVKGLSEKLRDSEKRKTGKNVM